MTFARASSVACAASAALSLLAGCAVAPHSRGAGAVSPFAVRPVAWNPARAGVGRVRAVADAGDVVAVFGDAGATVLSSGAVVATDGKVTDWVDADTVRGADGAARWIIGIDARGRIYYLRGLSSFDDVSARYGLDGRAVHAAAMLDAGRVGFLVDGEIAIADGRRVALFGPVSPAPLRPPLLQSFVGGDGFGAGVTSAGVVLFDASSLTARTYALPGASRVAIGAGGRLFAATRRALYATTATGELALVYDAGGNSLHGLAASGDHVWFADGAELGLVEGDKVSETTAAPIAADATLDGSPSGDVWVLAAGGLQRFARTDAEPSVALTWSTTLAPIFARSCSACHVPGGVAGVDLSTPEAWQSERAEIRDRVVVTGTMPPEGHALSAPDRDAIRAWAGVR